MKDKPIIIHQRTKNKEKKLVRIPRPTGSTFLCKNYINNNSTENKERFLNHIINQYINNNLTINNKYVSLDKLANMLNIDNMQLLNRFYKQMGKYGTLMQKDGFKDILGALVVSGIGQNLEDRSLIMNQLGLLKASQQGTYKPYLSSSVNMILGTLVQQSKASMDWYKTLSAGASNTTINMQNNFTAETNAKYKSSNQITQQDAMKMIEDSGKNSFAYDEGSQQKLLEAHGLLGVPEVRANYQDSVSTDGIKITTPINKTSKNTHNTRRSRELGIDEENDDQI